MLWDRGDQHWAARPELVRHWVTASGTALPLCDDAAALRREFFAVDGRNMRRVPTKIGAPDPKLLLVRRSQIGRKPVAVAAASASAVV